MIVEILEIQHLAFEIEAMTERHPSEITPLLDRLAALQEEAIQRNGLVDIDQDIDTADAESL